MIYAQRCGVVMLSIEKFRCIIHCRCHITCLTWMKSLHFTWDSSNFLLYTHHYFALACDMQSDFWLCFCAVQWRDQKIFETCILYMTYSRRHTCFCIVRCHKFFVYFISIYFYSLHFFIDERRNSRLSSIHHGNKALCIDGKLPKSGSFHLNQMSRSSIEMSSS